MNCETVSGGEDLIEAGRTSPQRTAAVVLVAFAALALPLLPVAMVFASQLREKLSPVMASAAVILSGTKLVAALWGTVQGARQG